MTSFLLAAADVVGARKFVVCQARAGMDANMKPDHMDHAESIAQRLVEAVVAGSRMEYRVDQSKGQYDFDLYNPDGSLAAVEVTSSADQNIEQTYARLRNTRNGGAMVKTRVCGACRGVHRALKANNRVRRRPASVLMTLAIWERSIAEDSSPIASAATGLRFMPS